jgi:hypothetical protein
MTGEEFRAEIRKALAARARARRNQRGRRPRRQITGIRIQPPGTPDPPAPERR